MKKLYIFIKKFFGVFFILLSFGALQDNLLSGLLLIIAGLFCFPSFVKKLEKQTKHKLSRGAKYAIVLGCFFASIMVAGFSEINNIDTKVMSGEVTTTKDKVEVKKVEEPKKVLTPDEELLQSLQNVEDVLKDWDKLDAEFYSNYSGLDSWLEKKGKLITKGKSSDNADVVAKAKTVEKMLISYQVSTFPRLRKEYIGNLSKALWQFDIDVVGGGVKNSTVSFIGGRYANNKNKLDTHVEVKNILLLLRFKQDRYYWYEGSEYTYWDLETKNDNQI